MADVAMTDTKAEQQGQGLKFVDATHPTDAQTGTCPECYSKGYEEAERLRQGCPCLYTEPCDPRCTCVLPTSSSGCSRCCRYGSLSQRKAHAQRISAALDAHRQDQSGPANIAGDGDIP